MPTHAGGDDVTDAADALGVVLEMWRYTVKVCYYWKAALEVAESHRPHVVLLDIGLSCVDGFQLTSGNKHLRLVSATFGLRGRGDERPVLDVRRQTAPSQNRHELQSDVGLDGQETDHVDCRGNSELRDLCGRLTSMDAKQCKAMVTSESGLLGISETSSDMRDLLKRETQDVRATEAIALFCLGV